MKCKYYRKYYKALGERYGKFRGNGQITIYDDYIELHGKRVFSLIIRICIVFAILVITEIVTAALDGEFLRYSGATAVISVFLIDDFLLKTESLKVELKLIDKYVIDEKKKIIGFTFFGKSIFNPIALGGDPFNFLAKALRTKIPENEYVIEKYFSFSVQPKKKIDRFDK